MVVKSSWFKKRWYPLFAAAILLAGIILRFYGLPARWGLAFDQAHDVLVAREGLRRRTLPLMGPFASGANIVGGPQWYWVIMFFSALAPHWIWAPWLGLTLLSLFFVFLMIKIGTILGGQRLGLLSGLLAAFSPLQISQTASLTNQSPLSLLTALAIWAVLQLLKTKRLFFAFLLGTLVAAGVNIHLQGIGLFWLIPVTVILARPISFAAAAVFLVGFGLQFLPLVMVELETNFHNLNGLISYLLIDRHLQEGALGWGTYLFSFWPKLAAKLIGGFGGLVYFLGLAFVFWAVKDFFQKKISSKWLMIILGFGLIFISLRFYQGPKFESYFVFIHPFVFLLTAWVLEKIWAKQKWLAWGTILLLLAGAMKENLGHYAYEKNSLALLKAWQQELLVRFPDQKFALYDYQFKSRDKTASLALVLDNAGLIDDQGVKIGISRCALQAPGEPFLKNGYCLTDIDLDQRDGDDWAFHNPSEIWQATEEWYKISP